MCLRELKYNNAVERLYVLDVGLKSLNEQNFGCSQLSSKWKNILIMIYTNKNEWFEVQLIIFFLTNYMLTRQLSYVINI